MGRRTSRCVGKERKKTGGKNKKSTTYTYLVVPTHSKHNLYYNVISSTYVTPRLGIEPSPILQEGVVLLFQLVSLGNICFKEYHLFNWPRGVR